MFILDIFFTSKLGSKKGHISLAGSIFIAINAMYFPKYSNKVFDDIL